VTWRAPALIVTAFVAVILVVWFGPDLLDRPGLGEFVFVGQVCFVVAILSGLEALFRRLSW
jgi:hypothetical protein